MTAATITLIMSTVITNIISIMIIKKTRTIINMIMHMKMKNIVTMSTNMNIATNIKQLPQAMKDLANKTSKNQRTTITRLLKNLTKGMIMTTIMSIKRQSIVPMNTTKNTTNTIKLLITTMST